MAVKLGKSKVSIKETIDGVLKKVTRDVQLPKSATTVEDVLELCDGKLTSARGEKPGLIDAALSGINAFLRRKEQETIRLLLGGKDAVKKQLKETLLTAPGMTEAIAEKLAEQAVTESWSDEQEKARQSLTIVDAKSSDEDEDENEDEDGETEPTEEKTETETATAKE